MFSVPGKVDRDHVLPCQVVSAFKSSNHTTQIQLLLHLPGQSSVARNDNVYAQKKNSFGFPLTVFKFCGEVCWLVLLTA